MTTAGSKPDPSAIHWARMKESGTLTGLRFLFATYRLLGRRVFQILVLFASLYFVCVRGRQRSASLDYLRTHARYFPSNWRSKPGLRHSIFHFFQFGEAILDKLIAWSQPISESEFTVLDRQLVDELLADKSGQLIIGTHFGNLEYCRGFMQQHSNKIINILIYDRHSANFARAMEQVNAQSRLNIYQVDELDLNRILALKAKVADGEWLFIAADRRPVSGIYRTVCVDFLGRSAALPVGPYQLARTLACPVKLMFAYRRRGKVIFDLVPFADKIELTDRNRTQSITRYARKFAFELEKRCKLAPYQWFNFYDFWADPIASDAPPASPEDSRAARINAGANKSETSE